MIDPKELRIGNLIQNQTDICMLTTIETFPLASIEGYFFGATNIKTSNYQALDELEAKPIFLDAEWLFRLEFKKDPMNPKIFSN